MDQTIERKIVELLDQHRLMTVATNRPDGWPQATTVGYVNDGLTLPIHGVIGFVVSTVFVEWRVRHPGTRQKIGQQQTSEITPSAELSLSEELEDAGVEQPQTIQEEKIAHDIYEAFYRRRHACIRCGKFFETREQLAEHCKECIG